MLSLTTLGALRLRRADDGAPIGGPRRKPLALLAILAAAGDEGVARDRVVALLWPEESLERGRRSLAQTVYALRRETGCPGVVTGNGTLRLDPAVVSSDVAAFRAARARGDHGTAARAYGGPFLDAVYFKGCAEFEQWAERERARLARDYLDSVARLADDAIRQGDAPAAVQWLEPAFAADPLDEATAAALARALVAAGDRAGALRVVRAHEELLGHELAAEPSEGWRALREALRTGAAVALPTPVAAAPAVPPSSAASGAASSAASGPASSAPTGTPSGAPGRPPGEVRARGRRARDVALGVTLVAALVVALAARSRREASADPGAGPTVADSIIAIMPFRVGGADSALGYLRDGMVDLLAAPLGDGRTPRAADPEATLHALAREGSAGETALLRAARRVGASRAIVGSVVGSDARVVLTASLVHAATGQPLARARVQGSADSVAWLAERLAADLLMREHAARWGPARESASSLAETPFGALRAYLAGRAALRAGEVSMAQRHFADALAQDSTFALAALDLASAAAWTGDRRAAAAGFAAAMRLRDRLHPGDRAYLLALAGPAYPARSSFAQRIAAWDSATRAAPGRAEAWYELGDQYFHAGRLLDVREPVARARAAFERAAALDPIYLPPREHLVMLHAARHDVEATRRAFAEYVAIDSTSEMAEFLRWRVFRAVSDPSTPYRPARPFDSLPRLTLRWIAESAPYDGSLMAGAGIAESRRAVSLLWRRSTTFADRLEAALAAHADALNRGRPSEAAALVDTLRALGAFSGENLRHPILAALYGPRSARADALAEAAADQVARELRPGPHADADPLDPDADERGRAQGACIVAQWRLRRGDTAAAVAAERAIAVVEQAHPGVRDDAAGCRLLLVALRGGPRALAAADSLHAMLARGADLRRSYPYVALALARAYVALGRHDRALDVAGRYTYFGRWPYYLASQLALEGELAAAAGQRRRAACALAHYVTLRDAPEAEAAAEVAAARARLERLAGTAAPIAVARRFGCTRDDPAVTGS